MTTTEEASVGPAGSCWVITEADVYDGIPEDVYHADPVPGGSLSASGARKLLPPHCPAVFKWERDHPTPSTKAQEVGTAAHRLVLGAGPGIVSVSADNWRTNDAKKAAADARAQGLIPVLASQYEEVRLMVEAVLANPEAAALFESGTGKSEQSMFWQDPETGVWRRARTDWLPAPGVRDRFILGDFKTTKSADPETFAKSVYDWGYYMQDPWYRDGVIALGLDDNPAFVFVVQEKTPPYLVAVYYLSAEDLKLGQARNRAAIRTYARCTETGEWPGYGVAAVQQIEMPRWARYRLEDEVAA